MPLFMLHISADLENLTDLQPENGCDDPSYTYYFKLKCENCGEISQKHTCVALNETVPLSTGRDTAHLIQKCKLCGREGNLRMIPGCGEPLTLEKSQSQLPAKLMLFDCRGYEPVEFAFADGWKAQSVWGTPFKIDLSEGDFADYDEKGKEPVGVSNMKGSFKVAHKITSYGGKVRYA